MNPMYPGICGQLLGEIISEHRLEGEYRDDDIFAVIKKLINSLNDKLQNTVANFCFYDVNITMLRALGSFYFTSINEEVALLKHSTPSGKNVGSQVSELKSTTGVVGNALERLIEAALTERSISNYFPTVSDLTELFELAYETVYANIGLESYLCLWSNKGKLVITKNAWHLECEEVTGKRVDDILHELGEEHGRKMGPVFETDNDVPDPADFVSSLESLRHKKNGRIPTELGADCDEMILAIDDKHRARFGHSFSERLLAHCYLAGSNLPELSFEDDVNHFLESKLCISSDTAGTLLSVLCLTGENLRTENAPMQVRRINRLMRRPVPRFIVGPRAVLFISGPLLGRGIINLISEYMGGTHPELENTDIKVTLGRLNQEYSKYFVTERIAPNLRAQGYTVKCHTKKIGLWNLETPEIGEIDIMATKGSSDVLIIGECKFKALPNTRVRRMRHEFSAYAEENDGYQDRLERKLKWVNQHLAEVKKFLGCDESPASIRCIPVFITNLYSPAATLMTNIPIIQEHEMDEWLKSIGG